MKSIASIEQHACIVCGRVYDTGAVLLDKRLREKLDEHTVTGWGLCPEHEQLHQEGYVALVEVEDEGKNVMTPATVKRLGRIIHIKSDVACRLFNQNISMDTPAIWAQPELCDMLENMEKDRQKAESNDGD